MNGVRGRLAKWHAALREIIAGLEAISKKADDLDIKSGLAVIREKAIDLDEDLQNRRVMAESYATLAKLDIPFARRWLQDIEMEILVEALRDQQTVIVKLLDAIEKAKQK